MGEVIIAKIGGAAESKTSISSATVTLVSGTLTYDGTSKTQNVASVVVNGQTLTAGTDYTVTNNVHTDAGDYTLIITGTGAYKDTKSVDWSINKATGSISVNPTSMSIQGVGSTDTATLTVVGDGTISVDTSASGVATASRSGNTVTVTSAGSGSATITITLAAGTNYTGDSATISVSVVTISATLSENTPAQIQSAAQSGTAASVWSVGARTAEINFQNVTAGLLSFNGLSTCAFILGFDHNSDKEGTGIHFQIGMNTSGTKIAFCDSYYGDINGGFRMNTSNTNSGGWNSSNMRTRICPAFLSALPTEWQNVIASTSKYTDNTGGGSSSASQSATSDKIWLLSEYEVFGSQTYAVSSESGSQVQYDYYKNGNSKVFYKHNATSTACLWWLRSPYSNRSDSFCYVIIGGGSDYYDAYYSLGFAPGFRIA